MIKKIFTLLLVSSSFFASAQYGIEVNYGLNGSYDPKYNGMTHIGAGLTYDIDEVFGAKIDFAIDEFSIQNDLRAMKTGTTNTRFTAQGVLNLSTLADSRATLKPFNIIAHAGGGVSILKSDIADYPNTDHLFNVIIGITPRFEVAEKLYLTADFSALFNVSQHYLFNGELAYTQAPNSFTGFMYNASLGVAYKFGQ